MRPSKSGWFPKYRLTPAMDRRIGLPQSRWFHAAIADRYEPGSLLRQLDETFLFDHRETRTALASCGQRFGVVVEPGDGDAGHGRRQGEHFERFRYHRTQHLVLAQRYQVGLEFGVGGKRHTRRRPLDVPGEVGERFDDEIDGSHPQKHTRQPASVNVFLLVPELEFVELRVVATPG